MNSGTEVLPVIPLFRQGQDITGSPNLVKFAVLSVPRLDWRWSKGRIIYGLVLDMRKLTYGGMILPFTTDTRRLTHRNSNFGLLFVFLAFYLFAYLLASELVHSKRSNGEVLVFRRGHRKRNSYSQKDVETTISPAGISTCKPPDEIRNVLEIQKHTSIFHWENVCLDITIKKDVRRILDHVDGWIKPGTITALMV